MRDEHALAVDDEGVTGLADHDPRDDVPDELEIHRGDGDARLLAAAGHGDRHVGLGLLPEGDGPVIDLAGLGLEELRLVRVIGAAAGDVHRQARDAQLLLALRVQVADFRDRQHLAQEAKIVDAALVGNGRGRPELRLGGPADLLLDLLDVRLDARRDADRLLALQRDERLAVLVVGEVDLDGAGRQQGSTDQPGDDDDVLPEEMAPRCHDSRFTPTISSAAAGPIFPGSA